MAAVVVTATRQVLSPGDTLRLTAQVQDAQGRVLPTQTVTWTNNTPGVATVDGQGLVRAIAEGTATIVASAGGQSGSTNLVVTVVQFCDCTKILDSTVVSLISRNDTTGLYVFRVLRTPAPALDSGAIIVGAQNGGYLRRVRRSSLTADRLELQTSVAYVEQAVREGAFATTVLGPDEAGTARPGQSWWGPWTTTYLAPGAALAGGLCCSLSGLQISASTATNPSGSVTFTIKQGEVVFDPRVDIGAKFGFFTLERFHAIFSGDLGLNIDEYEIKIAAALGLPDSVKKKLEKLRKERVTFITQQRPFAAFIGPMPVAGRIIKRISLEITPTVGASVTFSGKFRTGFGVTAGGRYERSSGWSPVSGTSSYFDATPPQLAAAEASASVKIAVVPELFVEFYGVGGPFINVEPYAEAAAKVVATFDNLVPIGLDWETTVALGLNLNLGLRLSLLGFLDLSTGFQIPLVQPLLLIQAFSDGPLTVRASSVGSDIPAGYTLRLRPTFEPKDAVLGRNHETSTQDAPIAANGSTVLRAIRSGPGFRHGLELADVPGNCAAVGGNPVTVFVSSDAFVTFGGAPSGTNFNLNCVPLGDLTIRALATGPDASLRHTVTLARLDAGGVGKGSPPLTLSIPGGSAADTVVENFVPANTASGATGRVAATLRPGRRNCATARPATHQVVVQSGDTVATEFRITCVKLGHVRLEAATVDPDPPPTSGSIAFTPLVAPQLAADSADQLPALPGLILAGTSSTVSGLVPLYNASGASGRYQVSLTGAPNRCVDTGRFIRRVTVFPGDTAIADFDARCVERLHVAVRTTGPGADPDGYDVVVQNPNGTADTVVRIVSDTTVGIAGIAPGSRTVRLADVDPSCVAPPDKQALVSARDSIRVAFDVACPAPAAPALRATHVGTTLVDLAWTAPTGPQVAYYRLYRNGTLVDTTVATTFSDPGLSPFTWFTYQVSGVSPSGLEGAKGLLQVRTRDATPPSAPTALVASAVSGTRIDLAWQPAVDLESRVAEYLIYRGGVQVGRSSFTTFSDVGLTPGTAYLYVVSALNGDGLEGPRSNSASASTLDVTPPTAPTVLQATAISSTQIDLSWTAASDPQSGIRHYNVYRNQSLVGTSTQLRFSDTNLTPSTPYTYTVTAVNGANLQGPASLPATAVTLPDNTPPTAPTGLTAIAVSSSQIDLSWTAASDPGSGIARYRVYRNGVLADSSTTTTFTDAGRTPATTYSYEVSAVNGVGLEGARSQPATATTPPSATGDLLVVTRAAGPGVPAGFQVQVTGSGVNLTRPIGVRDSTTFSLPAQTYTVLLLGVPTSCSVDGVNPRSVTVTVGALLRTLFGVSCP